MEGIELNKLAIEMGKIIKLLSKLEPKIKNSNDVYEYKDDLYFIAYVCRVSLLDRIEKNSWMQMTTPVAIPMGFFSIRKETISTGLMLTVEKVKKIASINFEIRSDIKSILEKEYFFYEFDGVLPANLKAKL